MKKAFIIIALAVIAATNGVAHAKGNVGQCVYPKTKPFQKGRLEFQNPIAIYKIPGASEFEILKDLTAFTVKAESKGLIQLVTVPDYDLADPDKAAGKVVGWAKLSDFKILPLRNCS